MTRTFSRLTIITKASGVLLWVWLSFPVFGERFPNPKVTTSEADPTRIFVEIRRKDIPYYLRWPDRETGPNIKAINQSGVYHAPSAERLWEIPVTNLPKQYIWNDAFEHWAQYEYESPNELRDASQTAFILFDKGNEVGRYSYEDFIRKPRDAKHFGYRGWLRTAFYLEGQLHILTEDRVLPFLGFRLPLGGSERIIMDATTGQIVSRKNSPFYTGGYLASLGGITLVAYVILRVLWRWMPTRRV